MSEPSGEPASASRSPSLGFMLSHPWRIIAQGFGSGLLPFMPGTAGTLFGWLAYVIPTAIWPDLFTPALWFLLIVAGFALGIPACNQTGAALGAPDHGSMVWDEIIAFWLVLVFLPAGNWRIQAAGFVLFRLFDMLKPPPIRYFDQKIKGGFGVMWDDIMAAFYTLLSLSLIRALFFKWGSL